MQTECADADRRRLVRRAMAAGAVLCASVLLAACGGSDSTDNSTATNAGATGASTTSTTSDTSTSGAKPSGEPIKTMTIAADDYNGTSFANILATAKLAEQWINDHGGIAGRPLEVTTCDERGDPNTLAACGRKAIQNKDVAVVGSFTLNGDSIVPVLEAAKTAWFGICCAVQATELTSPVSLQIGSGLSLISAEMVKAAQDGCKKIALVALDAGALTDFTITLAKNGLKSVNGPPLAKTVLLPPTVQDYAPQVAQATSGTDCIVGQVGETNWLALMPALQQAGATQRLYGPQGNLDGKVVKPFPKLSEGAVVAGSYADLSLPAYQDLRDAIEQYDPPSDLDYNSLAALGTWAAYQAFKEVAESVNGPLNNETFLAAAQKATVHLDKMAADVDFAKRWHGLGKSFLNAVNRNVTFDIVKDGKLTPFEDGAFYDMTNAMLGQPLSPENTPPGGSGS